MTVIKHTPASSKVKVYLIQDKEVLRVTGGYGTHLMTAYKATEVVSPTIHPPSSPGKFLLQLEAEITPVS